MSSSVALTILSSYMTGYAISRLADPILDAAIEGFSALLAQVSSSRIATAKGAEIYFSSAPSTLTN